MIIDLSLKLFAVLVSIQLLLIYFTNYYKTSETKKIKLEDKEISMKKLKIPIPSLFLMLILSSQTFATGDTVYFTFKVALNITKLTPDVKSVTLKCGVGKIITHTDRGMTGPHRAEGIGKAEVKLIPNLNRSIQREVTLKIKTTSRLMKKFHYESAYKNYICSLYVKNGAGVTNNIMYQPDFDPQSYYIWYRSRRGTTYGTGRKKIGIQGKFSDGNTLNPTTTPNVASPQ